MAHVTAQLTGPHPTVTVDGVDVQCAELYVTHRRNEFPTVAIVLDTNDGEVSLDGAVEVHRRTDVTAFLQSVDVKKLEEAAMANASFADNPFENALRVLKELARAES